MKLLVVAADPIDEYRKKGLDAVAASRYYNPDSCFAEVRILDLFGEGAVCWAGWEHQLLLPPAAASFASWWSAAGLHTAEQALFDSLMLYGYPGLPKEWIQAIASYGPDCVRGYNGGRAGFVATEIATALKCASLISVHDARALSPRAVQAADAIMAVSEAVASKCVLAGADPSRVVTVHDRVDRALFSPLGPKVMGPPGSPRILCVARDSPEKNIDRLLKGLARVRQTFPDLVLVHAGASSRDWSEYGFVTHVDSIPNTELPAWYRWADWLVHLSLTEGFGIVLAEALSCGLPVLTSNRAPMNQIVRNGFTGLVCDPESVEDIVSTVLRALEQPSLRDKFAANAPASTLQFDIRAIEAREAALYQSILAPERPLVSVVLPTYRRAHLIESAVRNVLAQDYPNLELIVVDDGSPDDTGKVLRRLQEEFFGRPMRVISKPNEGLPLALNSGFDVAKGELFTWTSDDNAYLPGAITAMVRELELDPEAAMVFADFQWVRQDGTPGNVVTTGPVDDLIQRNVIGLCFLYRSESARRVGGYSPDMALAEDYDYWVRLKATGRLIHLERVLYQVGDEPDSLTRTRARDINEVASKVIAAQTANPRWRESMIRHKSALCQEYKRHGLIWRCLKTAIGLVVEFPSSGSGYWAAARAVIPMRLLNWTRRLRGIDAS